MGNVPPISLRFKIRLNCCLKSASVIEEVGVDSVDAAEKQHDEEEEQQQPPT